MPTDREIKQLVTTVAKKLEADPNRPYKVRRRKPGTMNSRGETGGIDEYEYRSMNNLRTQPLGDEETMRLNQGIENKSWIFVEVVPNVPGELPSSPDEFLDFGDQIEKKNHWWEVKLINDWDLIQGCKAVFVE